MPGAEIVCSSELHQSIHERLRGPYFLTSIGGWVTYGQTADLGANAMTWHIDFNRLLEVKVFVFIDQTIPGSGFQYCLNSHRKTLCIENSGVIDLPNRCSKTSSRRLIINANRINSGLVPIIVVTLVFFIKNVFLCIAYTLVNG